MKIIHLCLANYYIDNYGYQENIIAKMHKIQGHQVYIIASTETYLDNKTIGQINPSDYLSNDGIHITRLAYSNFLPNKIVRKLRIYKELYNNLEKINPDIIFIHGPQFLSITSITKYLKSNKKTKVYVDSHSDTINSAKNWFSKNILHKIIYRWCTLQIAPFTNFFWSTLPIRTKFLIDIYKIPKEKIKLLEFGADDTLFDINKKNAIRSNIRKKLGVEEDDFIIITGGKIDQRKNIHILIDAFNKIANQKIKLIIFGTPNDEMKYLFDKINKNKNIHYLGWQNQEIIYNLLLSSDLGFFPGTHSVLWEQCCGVGLPCVFKKWDDIQHVDIGGNCRFIDDISIDNIISEIDFIFNNKKTYKRMLDISLEKCINHFSFYNIAKRSIEL
ncbi:MAG: glycosyltransferase family 4 protein [Advenella sp.]|nr:glycosyltransferase family 4 protein [Advenella sp.]